jgi:SAM-dependent methyltransferase
MTSSLHHRNSACRLCGSRDLDIVLSLTPTPPANACVTSGQLAEEQPRFPLDVAFCGGCGHVQLVDIVAPAYLFSHYVYASSAAPVMAAHLRNYGLSVIERFKLKPGQFVAEVGSNDGTFLRAFKEAGLKVQGIDPAKNIAEKANQSGIDTIADFFNAELGRRVRESRGAADVIVANHVFAHVDDMQGFVDGVRHMLGPDGVFVFEVGYLVDVFQKTTFDTIYHEHLDFHRIEPLQRFFAANGLEMFDAERSDIQGGSLRGYVGFPGRHPMSDSIGKMAAHERSIGLHKPETLRLYADRVSRAGLELTTLLDGLKAQGKTIAAYGLPAKATTLMYHFGLDRQTIEYVVDDAPLKVGLFSPGLHVPILATETMYEKRPDYVVVLAWNFADSIISRHKAFSDAGGRFIVPLPNLAIR